MKQLLSILAATFALHYSSAMAQTQVSADTVYDLLLKPCATQALNQTTGTIPTDDEVQALIYASPDRIASITELMQTLSNGLEHSAQRTLLANYVAICVLKFVSNQ